MITEQLSAACSRGGDKEGRESEVEKLRMQLRQSEAGVRAKEFLCEEATDKPQLGVEKANKERDRKAFLRIQN